jgi:hypothetical protein
MAILVIAQELTGRAGGILDELERTIDLHGDPVEGGRKYRVTTEDSADQVQAWLQRELDALTDYGWTADIRITAAG